MNRIHRVIFNKARGALMVVNELTSTVQTKGTKTVVASVVAAMIAGLSASASATPADAVFSAEVPDLGLTAIRYESNFDAGGESYSRDFYAAAKVVDGTAAISGEARHQFTNDDVKAIRGTVFENDTLGLGMSGFGTLLDNGDYWSAAAGAWVNVAGTAPAQWQDANISVDVSADIENAQELDSIGVQVQQGAIEFGGASAVITAVNGLAAADSDDYSDAAGIVFDNVAESAKSHARSVTFNTDAKITAVSTGTNSDAFGAWMTANDETKTTLVFNKSAVVRAESAKGDAYGFVLAQIDNKDVTSPQTPPADQAERDAVLAPENAGRITANGLSLFVQGDVAVGVRADVGTFESLGETNITVAGSSQAYGLALIGYGNASFDGKTNIIANKGTGNGTALYLLSHEQQQEVKELEGTGLESPEYYQYVSRGTPTASFNGTTYIQGDVVTSDGSVLQLSGDVLVKGDVKSAGLIEAGLKGTGNLTVTGAVTFAESELKPDGRPTIHLNKLHLDGGSFTNTADILVDDTLTLTNVSAVNGWGDEKTGIAESGTQKDIEAKTVVLEGSTVLTNWGGLHADTIVLKDDSLYLEENDEFSAGSKDENALGITFSEGALEFAGGHLSDILSGGKRELRDISIALTDEELKDEGTEDASLKNGRVVFTDGTYSLDNVEIDLPKVVSAAPEELISPETVHFVIQGGTVDIDTFKGYMGDALISGGTVHISNLQAGYISNQQAGDERGEADSSHGFALQVNGGQFTFDNISVNDASLNLYPQNNRLTSGRLFINEGSVHSNYIYQSTAESAPSVHIGEAVAEFNETEGLYRLVGRQGSLSLNRIEIGNLGPDTTKFKLYRGTLNVYGGGLSIAEGGKLGANRGTITLYGGNSYIGGQLAPTAVDTANGTGGTNSSNVKAHAWLALRPFSVSETETSDAALTVGENGYVNVQFLDLGPGSRFINEGYVNTARPGEDPRENLTRLSLIGESNSVFANYGQVTFGPSEYTIANNDGTVTIWRDGDDFRGRYWQFDGKTTIKPATIDGELVGGAFFGGRTSVVGGEIDASYSSFYADGLTNDRLLYIGNGTVSISDMSLNADLAALDITSVKLFYEDAVLNVDSLEIAAGAKLGLNNGTVNVKNGSVAGLIEPTSVNFDEEGNAYETSVKPSGPSEGLLAVSGKLDVASTAKLNLGSLSVAEKAGVSLADGAEIIINTGSSVIAGAVNDIQPEHLTGKFTMNGGTLELSGGLFVDTFTLNDGVYTSKAGFVLNAREWFWNGGQYIADEVSEDEEFDYSWTTQAGQIEHLAGSKLTFIDTDGTPKDISNRLALEKGATVHVESSYQFGEVEVGTTSEETNGALLTVSGKGTILDTSALTVHEESEAVITENGTIEADELSLGGTLTVDGGTLSTYTKSVFSTALDEDGLNTPTELSGNDKLSFAEGSASSNVLAINDRLYNTGYALQAEKVYKNTTIVWNGTRQELKENVKVDIDDLADSSNSVFTDLDVAIGAGSSSVIEGTVVIDKDFGASTIKVDAGVSSSGKVEISSENSITLVGSNDAGTKVIDGAAEVKISGSLNLGQVGSDKNGGTIEASLKVEGEKASVSVNKGEFTLGDVKASQSTVKVEAEAKVSMQNLTIESSGTLAVNGSATIGKVTATDSAIEVTKDITITDKLELTGGSLNVGDGNADVKEMEAKGSEVKVGAGSVTIANLKLEGGTLTVDTGTAAIKEVTLKADTTLDLKKTDASLKNNVTEVTKLVIDAAEDVGHTITGALKAEELTLAAEDTSATINIGTTGTETSKGKAGALVLAGKDTSIRGLTFFLDPVWEDGDEVTDASRLIVNTTNVNGQIVVGNNSYVVLGTDSDAAFTSLFGEDGSLQWGNGHTLAAAYVANPITVKAEGALVVKDSLTALPGTIEGGTVTFGENALLVADLTNADENAFISTEGSLSVASSAKAVLIGSIRNGVAYRLTSGGGENSTFGADQVVGGNPLWNFSSNEDGTWTAQLQDAGEIFGSLMQGTAIANAGMQSSDEWVNSLLTDETGDFSNPASAAQLFDAAMNPAGALASFTTAYDRSSDLRRAVRAEAVSEEGPRLWAQLTGGKTKLKGISSGAQSLRTKTDAYGVIVGAEGSLEDFTIGGAISVGTGDTKNDAVSAKDDFDWYGFSVYGRTAVGGVDVLADASATFLKSDLTVCGKAAVDTDTTTAVWSIGAQVQKTFDVGVDVTPFVGMDIYHVRADGYSNGHGASVQDADATSVEFPIGATVAKTFEASCGATISPTFTLAVVPTAGDRDISSKVKFAGAESTYNFTFADDVKVRANLGVNASKGSFSFGLTAGYEWGNEERSSTNLMLRTKYAF